MPVLEDAIQRSRNLPINRFPNCIYRVDYASVSFRGVDAGCVRSNLQPMSRLSQDRFDFPWGDADQCPCGSGSIYVDCCKVGPRQLPYVKIPNLAPPGAPSGYTNPNCYMSPTNNCSEVISREHYISNAILSLFPSLTISGMPWLKGETKILTPKAVTAKILCERHNNALSPIDTFGLRAFNAFIGALDYAAGQERPGRAKHFLISGEGLELWMIKLAAGFHFGGIASGSDGVLRDTCEFPTNELVGTLTTGHLPRDGHLWVSQELGLVPRGQLLVGPLVNEATNLNSGVRVQFGPLEFQTTLVRPPMTNEQFATWAPRHRPRAIDFSGPARDARVVMTWKGMKTNILRLTLG